MSNGMVAIRVERPRRVIKIWGLGFNLAYSTLSQCEANTTSRRLTVVLAQHVLKLLHVQLDAVGLQLDLEAQREQLYLILFQLRHYRKYCRIYYLK